MFKHDNFRVDFNTADYSDLTFSPKDREVLRRLAGEIAEIAARPVMDERRKLWFAHNALGKTRPLILCDPENGWNEIITDDQIECTNSVARHWECFLRKQLFWGNRMDDDYVVEAKLFMPYVFQSTPWRVAGRDKVVTMHSTDLTGGAYHIDPVLDDYAQLKDLVKAELIVDYPTSARVLALAQETLGDLLEVTQDTAWYWSVGLTDEFAFLRGLEKLLYDFYEEPDGIHALMERLCQGQLERLDFLEANGLFTLNNRSHYVGSGGIGFTNELPGDDFAGKVGTRHLWALAESQVTVGISPDMFAEFIFPYQKRVMERFVLTCYGCCEPMDNRIDLVKTVKNLRRVSVSPWANKPIMAEKLGHDYVYSLKVSPTPLSMPSLDEDHVRKELRVQLQAAKGCCLELIMKDNHTLGKNPRNLTRWVEIAREEIAAL